MSNNDDNNETIVVYPKNKTIVVSPETHAELFKLGVRGETMEETIKKLLVVYRETQEGKQQ